MAVKRKQAAAAAAAVSASREGRKPSQPAAVAAGGSDSDDGGAAAAAAAAAMSPSKVRKTEKLERTRSRNPVVDFIRACGLAYHRVIERCEGPEREERVKQALAFVYKADSATDEAFANKARLPSVSRLLQVCMKFGASAEREFIVARLGTAEQFLALANSDSGWHLCVSMLKHADAETQRRLAGVITGVRSLDALFSRNMSRVAARLSALPAPFDGRAAERQLAYRLCVPPVVDFQRGGLAAGVSAPASATVYRSLDDRGKKQMREFTLKNVTRALDKELADRSYFHAVFEAYAIFLEPSRADVAAAGAGADSTPLSRRLRDARRAFFDLMKPCLPLLLSSAAGCGALCRLLAVADARERKAFLAQQLRDAGISAADLAHNAVTAAVGLFALTHVDDTRLLKETLLAPLLRCGSKTAALEEGGATAIRAAAQSRAARKLLLVVLTQAAARYLTAAEVALVTLPSETSRKSAERRRQELLALLLPALGASLAAETAAGELVEQWVCNLEARDVLVEFLAADAAGLAEGILSVYAGGAGGGAAGDDTAAGGAVGGGDSNGDPGAGSAGTSATAAARSDDCSGGGSATAGGGGSATAGVSSKRKKKGGASAASPRAGGESGESAAKRRTKESGAAAGATGAAQSDVGTTGAGPTAAGDGAAGAADAFSPAAIVYDAVLAAISGDGAAAIFDHSTGHRTLVRLLRIGATCDEGKGRAFRYAGGAECVPLRRRAAGGRTFLEDVLRVLARRADSILATRGIFVAAEALGLAATAPEGFVQAEALSAARRACAKALAALCKRGSVEETSNGYLALKAKLDAEPGKPADAA